MNAMIDQIKRVWPKANWSISFRDKTFVGYVSNGETIGTKRFASGWQESNSAEDALDKAFRMALHNVWRSEVTK